MERTGRRPLRAHLLSAALAAVLGCTPRPPSELRVGMIVPMSGPFETLGRNAIEGARLAGAQLEKAGGLAIGKQRFSLVLVTRDGQTSPEMAVAAAEELINKEDISVLIGPPMSAQAIPVAQLSSRAGMPMIAQFATHPDVTRGTSRVIRLCFVDTFQGTVLARFARERLEARRAAVLYDETNPFPRDMADVFRAQFEAAGGTVVAYEHFTTGDLDHGEALRRIAASHADVLLLPNYREDLLLIGGEIRELSISTQILGCDTMRFPTLEQARVYNGAYVTAHFAGDSPAPEARAFSESYRAAYGHAPTDSSALTYDAMNLLAQVASSVRSVESAEIARGLAVLREYHGVTGTMRFDGSPDPAKSVTIAMIRDGLLVFQAQVDP